MSPAVVSGSSGEDAQRLTTWASSEGNGAAATANGFDAFAFASKVSDGV
jgi:hypothetical protein